MRAGHRLQDSLDNLTNKQITCTILPVDYKNHSNARHIICCHAPKYSKPPQNRDRGSTVVNCCATNQKVAGSIPDGVIGIFHLHNPPDRTMALGSTQRLIEMSTRNIS